jgi:hypothetical protein
MDSETDFLLHPLLFYMIYKKVGILFNCLVTNIIHKWWVRSRLCKLQKGYIRLAATSDKVYQLLAHDPWFSPASSTTKTGCQDIAESGVKHNKNKQIYTSDM